MIPTPLSLVSAISALASRLFFGNSTKRNTLPVLCVLLAAVLFGMATIAPAQTVTENFGTVNVGTTSSSIPLVFTFGTADTLSSVTVLTQGATGLDFADAGSDTCTQGNAYSSGQTCTVNVTFTPHFAGNRIGAVVLVDPSKNIIATGRLQGTGVGPQINFLPGTQFAYATGGTGPVGVVVDGYGDIYLSVAGSGVVFEAAAVNGVVPPAPVFKTVASGFGTTVWMAIDGSGNLYLADTSNSVVKEILAVNGVIPTSPTIRTLGSGFSDPTGIAVDGVGNVYVTGLLDGTVKEILAVNGTIPASPTIKTLSTLSHPTGLAVDDSGNLFVSDEGTNLVKEILAVNGSIPASPTINTLGSGFDQPYGVAVDANGNVYVADYANNALKEIVAASGYTTVKALGGGFTNPGAVFMDGGGNIYVGDYGNDRIVKLDLADPPSLTFASTAVGATSSDSPRTVTVENIGNAALTFPIPSTGDNPAISTNFSLNSNGSSDCSLLTTQSPESATLAAGASCQLPISFVPTTTGALSGSLILTDNNLEASASNYTSQSITLNGTGAVGFSLGTSPSSVNIPQGSSATSTVTVTPQTGFTGTVSLSASGLPSGVTASFSPSATTGTSVLTLTASSTSSLASAQSITITGTSGSITETTTLLLTVNPANFTLSDTPSSLILNQGSSTTSTVIVNDQNGFNGSVSLSAPNLPSGVTASFSPNPTNLTSVLTLTASSSVTTGTYFVGVTGVSGAEVAEAPNMVLTVSPPPAITLTAAPTSLTVAPGSSNSTSIEVGTNFSGNVTLSASGLPSGVTASFSPNPMTGTGFSSLTFAASSSATPGTYNVTVTGADGAITATTTVLLTVSQPTFFVGSSIISAGMIQGTSFTSSITILPQPGFSGNVTLSASGLPSGVTASFSQNPTATTSLLTITASASATIGYGTIIITGTAGAVSASVQLNISIVAPSPSFTLGLSPTSLNVVQGASGSSAVSLIGANGFSASVNLTASSLPTGVTASFNPNSTTGTSVLTLAASSSATAGTYDVIVSGTQGPGWPTESSTLVLTIAATPGFSPSSENFGSMNIGTTSPAQTLTYTFGNAVTLGSTSVLTQGATGLDFADAGSDTCTPNTAYTAGQSCAVNVTFTPKVAGARSGAVVLNDNNGNVLATAYLEGTGVGPQLNFLPGTESTLASGFNTPAGIAVDGSGNMYVADYNNNAVEEILAVNGSIPPSPTVIQLGTDFNFPTGIAVDGAGNVYVSDSGSSTVKEILAVNGSIPSSPTINTLGSGFYFPTGVTVDGTGNVFVADQGNNAVKEIIAANGSIPASPTINTLGSGFSAPKSVAVDTIGNVYVSDYDNSAVKEILAVNGIIPAHPTINTLLSATLNSGFASPGGIAVDGFGDVFVANDGYDEIDEIQSVNGVFPASPAIIPLASIALGSGLNEPWGVAVDGFGNVLVADTGNNRAVKLDQADAPSLTFASTNVGSTSPDSPQTVTVENIGNAALTFPVPSSGNNPSIATNFTLNSNGASACPLLSAASSTPGTLAAEASCQLSISFTPIAAGAFSGSLVLTDNNLNAAAPAYAVQNLTLNGTATQATPAITWTPPAPITYGTALSATQLNATSTTAGTFTYSPAAGTVLTAGLQSLTATFTPTDTTDYTTATSTVTLTVNQATPTVTWNPSAPITYGAPLSASQLNASSTVPGTFIYSPVAGTVLGAGQQILTETFTPTDTTDYTSTTTSVALTVNKAIPPIAWAAPAAILYSTPLSATQLNASSTVAGTFTYTPPAGTILNAGAQTLTVIFTPTDTVDYTTARGSVPLTVNKAPLTISWPAPAAIPYGTALSATQLDAKSNAAGTFSYSPSAGTVLSVGNHSLTVTFTPATPADYTTATATGSVTLTVNKATPTITWATPPAITYGTKLSGTQLDASSTIAGAFTYSPASGTVLSAGSNTLTATFTPTNTTDYTTATAKVTLVVNKATPAITWATPKAITYGTALSATQLDASTTIAGTFKYSPASGTVLGAGSQTLTVTFTPTNAADYTTASASVTLTVNKATPAITWATPKAITSGTPLSATQLDATSKIAGTFTYSPAAGTVLAVGNQKLTATFTPTDTTDYTTATASVTLTVNR